MTIIAIANQKGGVGKSTQALNLACYLNMRNVVDLDLSTKTLTMLINIRNQNKSACGINCFRFDDVNEYIDFYQKNNGDLIVDCGGQDSDLTRLALKTADIILTPTATSTNDIAGLIALNDTLRELDVYAHAFACRVNSKRQNFKNLVDSVEALKLDRISVLSSKISELQICQKSTDSGLAVVEYDKYSQSNREQLALTQEVINLIQY